MTQRIGRVEQLLIIVVWSIWYIVTRMTTVFADGAVVGPGTNVAGSGRGWI